MGDFSEMDIFRKKAPKKNDHGEPRCTRICTKCLEQSTPWVKYDFVCRRFRCETRLVPSDIAERKRFRTFGSSPLNLLPEDGLVAIVDFLNGSDLKQLFLTCSAMCTVAERVAKEKVERVNNEYPTGPIATTKRKNESGRMIDTPYFEGRNDFGLRAPDDEKAWVGVYHYLEKVTQEMFYFGFQMKGPGADSEVVGRFLNQSRNTKFAFGQAYSKVENNLVECPTVGMSVRGGCVLVTGKPDEVISPSPLVMASGQRLETGIHRVICRLCCPGMGSARSNREAQTFKLGSIGILCTNQRGEGPTNAWAQRQDVMESWMKEDVVFGIEYNADERELVIHANSHLSRSSTFVSNTYTVAESPGDLYIAAELTSKSANVAQSLLTVRNCDAEEWTKFIENTTEGLQVFSRAGAIANGANIFDPMVAMEAAMEFNVDRGVGIGNNVGVRLGPVLREAMRNRRRDRAPDADDDDAGNFHRIQVRAMEGGRRAIARLMPRRRDIAPAAAAQDDEVVAAVEGVQEVGRMEQEQPPTDNNNEGQQRPVPRRVMRAVRPFAMAEQLHNEYDEDSDDDSFPIIAEGVQGGVQRDQPPTANNSDGQQRPGPRRVVPAVRYFARAAAMAEQVHIESDDDAEDDWAMAVNNDFF